MQSLKCMSCLFPDIFIQYFGCILPYVTPNHRKHGWKEKPHQCVWVWNILHKGSFNLCWLGPSCWHYFEGLWYPVTEIRAEVFLGVALECLTHFWCCLSSLISDLSRWDQVRVQSSTAMDGAILATMPSSTWWTPSPWNWELNMSSSKLLQPGILWRWQKWTECHLSTKAASVICTELFKLGMEMSISKKAVIW